ncbi:hypothetical protein SCHPADRAFT_158639 [Schizopora paradoxa]|uniref:Uncharacterized protein n=1 Tax=Schizopora paradoxa TaxID=27342 RepID=A0A0H2S113_9AGAM|nr:hypothetical protein SCHPADRAFT_158639 [Schizopora paradoxa]
MKDILLIFVLTFALQAVCTNDWTKACLGGSCSFDIEETPTNMGGTIQISGSSSSVSDITPAAGWQILNCTDSTNSQTIRLVCTNESLGCEHIFQDGARDTIVRLPQGCGRGPFVRIANHTISEDQSLPTNINSRVIKRGGTVTQVHALQIDDNFAQSSGQHGNVSFEIHAQGDFRVNNDSKQSKRQTGSGSTSGAVDIPAQSIFFFDTSLTCPAANDTTQTQTISGSLAAIQTQFDITVDVTSTGTMSPPNIETLSFSAPMNGALALDTIYNTGLQGSLEAANIPLGSAEFPSFSIDGIVEINPTFLATGDATMVAELLSNFAPLSSFSANINNLQFTFPSNDPPANVDITIPNGPFDVLAEPTLNSSAQFTFASLYEFDVQISAFSQSVDLSVAYNYFNDLQLVSTPSVNNSEQVCINITNSLAVAVSNSGAFFDAFSGTQSQSIFAQVVPVLSSCQILELGPSPQVALGTRPSLYSRDDVSCPPIATLPQTTIQIID